jgi:hypothetical protein
VKGRWGPGPTALAEAGKGARRQQVRGHGGGGGWSAHITRSRGKQGVRSRGLVRPGWRGPSRRHIVVFYLFKIIQMCLN